MVVANANVHHSQISLTDQKQMFYSNLLFSESWFISSWEFLQWSHIKIGCIWR